MTYSLIVLILGPIPEEIGWRGYAQPLMQHRYSVFKSSLIIGLFWMIWHIPLFTIDGYPLSAISFLSVEFVIYCLSIFALSVIIGWLFNQTKFSVASAILAHYASNYWGGLVPSNTLSDFFRLVFLLITTYYLWKSNSLTSYKQILPRQHSN